jgi:hypothetical protein
MAKLVNLARMNTVTTGTGTVTLSTAVSGYLTFALAGVSNGDIISYGIKDGSNSEVGTGVYTSAGTTLTRVPTASTNSNAAISLSGSAEIFVTARAEDLSSLGTIRGYLSGLTLSTAGASATFGIDLGNAADSTNIGMMSLSSAYTKTTSAWAVGTASGSLDTGTITASRTYHVFLIKRADTGIVDVLISLSATAPTMPGSYTLFRRIGSMLLNSSSQWVKFFQLNDDFWLDVPAADVVDASLVTTAVTRTLTLPSGIKTTSFLTIVSTAPSGSSMRSYVSSLDVSDQPASTSAFNIWAPVGSTSSASARVPSNTSSQIRSRCDGTGAGANFSIVTLGWNDMRGQS